MAKGTGLTAPQLEMLRDAARRPSRVVRGYKPAEKLAALGLVEIAITDAPYPWIVEATTSGRAALAERGGGGVMRVLVTGGRAYADRNRVYDELDAIHARTPISAIIEGGAAGADHFACLWSAKRNLDAHHRFSADWAINGRAAGPIRNARMLAEGKPDLVLAFPGGRGTADMVRRAEAAGVPVTRISSPGAQEDRSDG